MIKSIIKLIVISYVILQIFTMNVFAGNNEVLLAKEQARIDSITGPATGIANDGNTTNSNKEDKTNEQADIKLYNFEGKNYKIKESLGKYKTTAYCKDCSGNKTAIGNKPSINRTISTDWSLIPKGTKVLISGSDIVYVVEDSGVKGRVVDIFLANKKETKKYGVQNREIFILEEFN